MLQDRQKEDRVEIALERGRQFREIAEEETAAGMEPEAFIVEIGKDLHPRVVHPLGQTGDDAAHPATDIQHLVAGADERQGRPEPPRSDGGGEAAREPLRPHLTGKGGAWSGGTGFRFNSSRARAMPASN